MYKTAQTDQEKQSSLNEDLNSSKFLMPAKALYTKATSRSLGYF